jgi:hypothetical protein
MGGKSSSPQKKIELICPKCPLTPIISISLNAEGILTCEYRCPFMHFGLIPFEDMDKDKENNRGKYCDRCAKQNKEKKENEEKTNNIIIEEDLLYCGTCKQFICKKCIPEHKLDKDSHKTLVPRSEISYTCLEHGKTFKGFCFTCLISVCELCKRHEKHCIKNFEDFYPEKDFIENYEYYLKDYNSYLKSLSKCQGMNRNHFNRFKERNQILLNLVKFLFNNFEEKKSKKQLNGETLINLLNVVNFNYKAENAQLATNEQFVNYCKTHLLLSNKPISDICTFSKTKSDYNISKLLLEEYHPCASNSNPKDFKYFSLGGFIVYYIDYCIHFLNTSKTEEEKMGFKIRLDSQISSMNIINRNILCVCSQKIYLYELSNKPPFYSEYSKTKDLDIFSNPVVEVFGNLEKFLLVRTSKELLLVTEDKHNKGKYNIDQKIWLDDVNTIIQETKTVPDDSGEYHYYTYNRTKKITIYRNKITKIKATFNDYIVLIESGTITTRSLNDLKTIKTLKQYKDTDCIVFNGNVLVNDESNINFYSIPNLERVSQIKVADKILSLSIANKKTLIVLEEKYVEQFETNTWKRLWRQISLGENMANKSFDIIGAGKKLFFFHKEQKMFYQFVLQKDDKKKKK